MARPGGLDRRKAASREQSLGQDEQDSQDPQECAWEVRSTKGWQAGGKAVDWQADDKCRGLVSQWQAGFRACLVRKHSASHVLGVLGVL